MTNIRNRLVICFVFVFFIFAGKTVISVIAQGVIGLDKSLEIQTYNDHSIINTEQFPIVETRFMLKENDQHIQEQLTKNNITVFEDGLEIAPLEYITKVLPIHLTVVVDIDSVEDLNSASIPNDSGSDALIEDLIDVISYLSRNNDELQMCFTFGLPNCLPKENTDDSKILYHDMAENIQRKYSGREPSALLDILELGITAAEKSQKTPVIILIRAPKHDAPEYNKGSGEQLDAPEYDGGSGELPDVPEHDDGAREFPDIPELFLERLALKGGVFIVIDKNYEPSYRVELEKYLHRKGAYYYHTVGAVDDRSECLTLDACLFQNVTTTRYVQHIVTYESRLFRDSKPHELTISVNSDQGEGIDLSDTQRFLFKLTNTGSEINPFTYFANSLLAICAPLILMLILVFSIGSSSSKSQCNL